jgi:hypothetical protein
VAYGAPDLPFLPGFPLESAEPATADWDLERFADAYGGIRENSAGSTRNSHEFRVPCWETL